ncbi:MAG: carboxymuconolactone decarboxylase family protein [Candidatus Didemnitutus sp.]|nr:carboxymuconolactone decarboxylase family protein [Candidatus Didemnitutus sp.]
MSFPIQTPATAPSSAAQATLNEVQKTYGFIPNVYGALANSPLAVEAYLRLAKLIQERSVLSPAEQQVLMIALSAENGCEYCVAAHSVVAGMAKAPAETIQAVRDGRPAADARVAALTRFARAVVAHRGWVPADEIAAFHAAGFGENEILDVLTINALKTLSNYTNHLAQAPLDPAFASQAWKKSA